MDKFYENYTIIWNYITQNHVIYDIISRMIALIQLTLFIKYKDIYHSLLTIVTKMSW